MYFKWQMLLAALQPLESMDELNTLAHHKTLEVCLLRIGIDFRLSLVTLEHIVLF